MFAQNAAEEQKKSQSVYDAAGSDMPSRFPYKKGKRTASYPNGKEDVGGLYAGRNRTDTTSGKKSGIVLANRCLKLLCTSGCAKIPNTPRCSIGYTPSRVKFQSMPVSKNFKMYKMNSRNRGITAANAILRISCFIFRTVIAIFVQYYGIFDENRKKTDFLFCL